MRWCATASGSVQLRSGVLDRLRPIVSYDGAFFATVDPTTLLYTSGVRRGMPTEASPAFIRAELGDRDVNQLRDLARARSPVGWLDGATGGDRMVSLRYREAMRPIGLGDELRVALRVDGACWGLLCLHRSAAANGFTQQDVALLATLGPQLAEAVRREVVATKALAEVTVDGPGVAVVAPDGSVESATPAAARWLADLAELDVPRTGGVPTVVDAVIRRLVASPAIAADDAPLARARVRAPSGRWLVIHASHLEGPAPGRVAVVVEPAAAAVLAPLVVAAYALTARETEVLQRLVAGLARKAIAADLRISQHTVNDHVKSIFDKTGVSSVGQLRAHVFAEHFAPGR